MNPQLTPAQLQHALDNGAKLVAAKKLEVQAYAEFTIYAPAALLFLLKNDGTAPDTPPTILANSTRNLFQAKLMRAEVELEELEMQVNMYTHLQKQSNSRIQVPSGVKLG